MTIQQKTLLLWYNHQFWPVMYESTHWENIAWVATNQSVSSVYNFHASNSRFPTDAFMNFLVKNCGVKLFANFLPICTTNYLNFIKGLLTWRKLEYKKFASEDEKSGFLNLEIIFVEFSHNCNPVSCKKLLKFTT